MENLENELRSALARRDPPAHFTDQVLAATNRRPPGIYRLWVAAAAVFILLLAGVIERERRQRMEEQHAAEALVHAIEIANAKLDNVRHRVVNTGDSRP